MNLTEDQRAAVRTWRQGRGSNIVGDLPFVEGDMPLSDVSALSFGGKYHVAGYVAPLARDFILAATRAAVAGSEIVGTTGSIRRAVGQPAPRLLEQLLKTPMNTREQIAEDER